MIKPISKRLSTLGILAATIMLAACASAPPKPVVDYKPGYDFSQVSKIGFFEGSGTVSGQNPLTLSDMQRDRIDSALEVALSDKGYTVVGDATGADLLISWHLLTESKTDVRTYETPVVGSGVAVGVGYGRWRGYNRYSLYNCWSCPPLTQTEVSVRNFTQGTFIVDLIDPKLKKSVWRGVIQSRLTGKHAQDQDKYHAAAARIFASFPP